MLCGGLSRAAAAPRRFVRGELRLLRGPIERFDLSGATAASVQRALPPSGTAQDSLSVLSVIILVFTATSFTRALQRLSARAARGLRALPPARAVLLGAPVRQHQRGLHDRELALRRGAGAHRVGRGRRHAVADEALDG
jgi:hypothetical protein